MERPLFSSTLFAGLFVLAGLLAFLIDTQMRLAGEMGVHDPLSRFLGTAKEAMGDTLFLKADAYYHGGIAIRFEETEESHGREGKIEDETLPEKAAPLDWIAVVNSQVRSHRHYHLTKREQKEMLPFFALATTLDPRNVEALLTTAYWLDRHFRKTDEAIALLTKGVADNPDSWEIAAHLGNLYFRRKENYAMSERFYLEAVKKSGGKPLETYQKIDNYYFLAESYFRQGNKSEALSAYQEAYHLYAEKDSSALKGDIADKIKELSA